MMSLPIDKYLPDLVSAMTSSSQMILTATPGAGKTTRLPPHLLSSVQGKIAVLQPRRMAAISACQFVAEENHWTVGDRVGYQVRQDSKFKSETRLLFMTDAILIRRMIEDPELKEFDLIVIDEFHERNLNQDVTIALIKELQMMGRDIKLLIMSATLDLTELKIYFPESVVFDIPGQVHPLQIQYSNQALSLKTDFDFIQRVSSAIFNVDLLPWVEDILVFLPGVGEIQRLKTNLDEKKINRDVFVLHGALNLKEQNQVLKKHHSKRVILATNIAEASVTVVGVNAVIDTGLAKVTRLNVNGGFLTLNLASISKFNAKQRAGRAAREKPGLCLRLWTVHEDSSMDDQSTPEILRSDLSIVVLHLSYLGVSNPYTFMWYQAPSQVLLSQAQNYLKNIKALNSEGEVTDVGKSLLLYPLEPRHGIVLYKLEQMITNSILSKNKISEKIIHEFQTGLDQCVYVLSLLQDKDIYLQDQNRTSSSESDLKDRLQTIEEFENGVLNSKLVNRNQLRLVIENAASLKDIFLARFKKNHEMKDNKVLPSDLTSMLMKDSKAKSQSKMKFIDDFSILSELILSTQADRLCRRRANSERALMVGGRGVRLSPNSAVRSSEFFIALSGRDVSGQSETQISLAHGYTLQQVVHVLKDQIQFYEEPFYDSEKGQFYLKKGKRFKDLELDSPTLTKILPEDLGDKFLDILVLRWPELILNHKALNYWISRWQYFVNSDLEIASALELTKEQIRNALEQASYGLYSWDDVLKQNLVFFIESQIDSIVLKKFKSQVPESFLAPSGVTHSINYSLNESPYVEIRLQELFGLTITPKVGPKQIPLVFKLLAPNFRPVQVTSDIEGFWKRSYLEVKSELKRRYPKHSWPDDPLTAPAVSKGKRRV